MEESEKQDRRVDFYSKSVRAGKRTYFFDVKSTRSNELFITITESKRRFNESDGHFTYEKHKIFLYGEDFDKFREGLEAAIGFVEGNEPPFSGEEETDISTHESLDVSFEDLGAEDDN
ncbi:MAG: PUR family DNA/RNA-binding protein [Bacteroidetes bacterium]|jgi:hypothetical protein|nr:PUR family DNA/RNA-binding protein [Bacteroidota bacterium]